MVNGFIADVSGLRQHPLLLNSIKRLKLKPLPRDWLVNQYNGKLVETGKDNLSYFINVFYRVRWMDHLRFYTLFNSISAI